MRGCLSPATADIDFITRYPGRHRAEGAFFRASAAVVADIGIDLENAFRDGSRFHRAGRFYSALLQPRHDSA